MKEFESERLKFVKVKLDDADKMFNSYTGDPTVTKYLTWDAHKTVEDGMYMWLKK